MEMTFNIPVIKSADSIDFSRFDMLHDSRKDVEEIIEKLNAIIYSANKQYRMCECFGIDMDDGINKEYVKFMFHAPHWIGLHDNLFNIHAIVGELQYDDSSEEHEVVGANLVRFSHRGIGTTAKRVNIIKDNDSLSLTFQQESGRIIGFKWETHILRTKLTLLKNDKQTIDNLMREICGAILFHMAKTYNVYSLSNSYSNSGIIIKEACPIWIQRMILLLMKFASNCKLTSKKAIGCDAIYYALNNHIPDWQKSDQNFKSLIMQLKFEMMQRGMV